MTLFPTWPPRPWVLVAAVIITAIFFIGLGSPVLAAILIIVILVLAAPRLLRSLGNLGDRRR